MSEKKFPGEEKLLSEKKLLSEEEIGGVSGGTGSGALPTNMRMAPQVSPLGSVRSVRQANPVLTSVDVVGSDTVTKRIVMDKVASAVQADGTPIARPFLGKLED